MTYANQSSIPVDAFEGRADRTVESSVASAQDMFGQLASSAFLETRSFSARNSHHKTEKPTLSNGNPSGWVPFSARYWSAWNWWKHDGDDELPEPLDGMMHLFPSERTVLSTANPKRLGVLLW